MLHCRYCSAGLFMNQVVDEILSTCGGELDSEFLAASREKVSRYIEILASTGQHADQLTDYGRAYLQELKNPDPKYSGC